MARNCAGSTSSRDATQFVSAPSTSRPELLHSYAQLAPSCISQDYPAVFKLVDDAAQLEYSLEQELHSHRLIGKSNPSLAALYQVMLDLPAADGLAQGVYFAIQFQMGRQMVSHFFEGGSFSGFHYAKGLPPIMAHHQERQVNSYRVFTDADLFRRQHFLASRSSSISAKRYGKDSTDKQKSSTFKSYQCKMDLMKRHLQIFVTIIQDLPDLVKSIFIHVLKRNPSAAKRDHNYVFTHNLSPVCIGGGVEDLPK